MARANAVHGGYTRPCVTDLGSLTQLTSEFDASFHGSVAKLVSLAVASVPVPGGNTGGNTTNPGSSGGVLNTKSTSATTPSGSSSLTPSDVDPGTGTGQTVDDPQNGVLDSVNRANPSSDPGATSPASSTTPGKGSGGGDEGLAGSLPFTGYAAMLTAGVGAALAGTGAAVRSRLRRNRA